MMETNTQNGVNPETRQTIIIQQAEAKQSNGIGTAGFVLALIGLFLSWVPVLGWIVWILGLIFSIVGVFRMPKGLAIAGLVLSLLGLIILIILVTSIASGIGAAAMMNMM